MRWLALLLVVFVPALAACGRSSPSSERELIDHAVEWIGGADRLMAVRALVIEGEGEVALHGEGVTPFGPWLAWQVTDWRRALDLVGNRMRVWQSRQPTFPWPYPPPEPISYGLDGDVSYNVEHGEPHRVADVVATERRIEALHHPIVLLRTALTPGATLTHRRQESGYDVIDMTTPSGEQVSLSFDAAYGMLTLAVSSFYDRVLGDTSIETGFYRYVDQQGLKLPMRLVARIDRYQQYDFRVSRNTVDGDVAETEVPAQVRTAAAPPDVPKPVVTIEPVAHRVWLIGGESHHSVLCEFDNHLRLFGVPASEARTLAVIAAARRLRPDKPLTHAIVSHHHFEHVAGVRAAVSEGLTIVAVHQDETFLRDLVARPHSLHPDLLARQPRPMTLELVNGPIKIKDNEVWDNELVSYGLYVPGHVEQMVVGVLPTVHLAIHADLFTSTYTSFPFAGILDEFLELVKAENTTLHLPLHGEPQTRKDLINALAASPP